MSRRAAPPPSKSTWDLIQQHGFPLLLAGGVSVTATYFISTYRLDTAEKRIGEMIAAAREDHDAVTTLKSDFASLKSNVERNETERTKQLEGIGGDLKTIMMGMPRR